MRYSEKLKTRYYNELAETITDEYLSNNAELVTDDYGDIVNSVWLGSIVVLFPSGKIYMPWTTNQTVRDMIMDQAYSEALEEIAEQFGYFVSEFSGDIFLQSVQDIATDCYLTENGKTFYRGFGNNRETFDSYQEVLNAMERDGYFPGVYYQSNYGDISHYKPEEWEHLQ